MMMKQDGVDWGGQADGRDRGEKSGERREHHGFYEWCGGNRRRVVDRGRESCWGRDLSREDIEAMFWLPIDLSPRIVLDWTRLKMEERVGDLERQVSSELYQEVWELLSMWLGLTRRLAEDEARGKRDGVARATSRRMQEHSPEGLDGGLARKEEGSHTGSKE